MPQALDEINQALDYLEKSGAAALDPTMKATYLDTRGVIHYRMGNYEQALLDMEAAVSDTQVHYASQVRQLDWERQLSHDQKTFDQQVELMRHNLAVMHYHRGQVYEAIGRHDAAERDFEAAKQYGYSEELGVW